MKLKGKNASAEVISRSVARGSSVQKFYSDLRGESACFGHVECDGILLDHARIVSVPEIDAKSPEASLVHEAAVGKIAGEQILKLTTLGSPKRGGRRHYPGLPEISSGCEDTEDKICRSGQSC